MNVFPFLQESLAIEGINRGPTPHEIRAAYAFLESDLDLLGVLTLQSVIAPGHPLRNQRGMNVQVGAHTPMPGGKNVEQQLRTLVTQAEHNSPFIVYSWFQHLHPFMDGNGRTGRLLWAKRMLQLKEDPFRIPFLNRFHYQSLDYMDSQL